MPQKEWHLKAVFLLNRNENTQPTQKQVPENKKKQTEISLKPKQVQEEKSDELKLKKQVNTQYDNFSKRPKQKKRQTGHKIKVAKVERKKEMTSERGI